MIHSARGVSQHSANSPLKQPTRPSSGPCNTLNNSIRKISCTGNETVPNKVVRANILYVILAYCANKHWYFQIDLRVRLGADVHKQGEISRFDVRVSTAPPARPLHMEAGNRCVGKAIAASREYLRVYYGDYLSVSPAQKPKFANSAETMLECQDWVEWIRDAKPRTRVDAYPLLLVCKDLLDRFVRRELQLISRRTTELEAELVRAKSAIEAQAHELDALRDHLGSHSDSRQV
jgi:hypothetical protein